MVEYFKFQVILSFRISIENRTNNPHNRKYVGYLLNYLNILITAVFYLEIFTVNVIQSNCYL